MTHRVDRSKPINHVWIVLLLISFLQIIITTPMTMSFYYLEQVWPPTDSYCVWWTWLQYSIPAISLILMAWASIERHFFIFYPTFMARAWKKWIYHIIPIAFCILFPSLWYIALVIITPNCTNIWDFNYNNCGVPCYTTADKGIYTILDTVLTMIIPLSLLISANITLIVRVVYKKISRHQVVHWGRHRKMAFQLWCISLLYLGPWVPSATTVLLELVGVPSYLNNVLPKMIFMCNCIPLLLPFVFLCVFPEIPKTIDNFLRKRNRNQVGTVLLRTQTQFQTKK
jgi:hypothetical protein